MAHTPNIMERLAALEKQGEDYIWRTAQEARAEIDRLLEANRALTEALEKIGYEAGQYADGADDAHYLAKVLADVEGKAGAALAKHGSK